MLGDVTPLNSPATIMTIPQSKGLLYSGLRQLNITTPPQGRQRSERQCHGPWRTLNRRSMRMVKPGDALRCMSVQQMEQTPCLEPVRHKQPS